jgi:hypothetical protein
VSSGTPTADLLVAKAPPAADSSADRMNIEMNAIRLLDPKEVVDAVRDLDLAILKLMNLATSKKWDLEEWRKKRPTVLGTA